MLNAQTYVDQNASGANDGSSWADAYTVLDSAFTKTESGDIWVAAGTYTPGGGLPESRFLINTSVNVYGGFSGTETSIDDRDLSTLTTILSADHLGNDTPGSIDSTERADNSANIIVIDSLLDNVTIDGFAINNGFGQTGSGILTFSPITVRNAHFDANSGVAGAAVYIAGDLIPIAGCSFENVEVSNGFANSQSTGIFAANVINLSVTNSDFHDNFGARGAVYPLRCNGVTITDCTFSDNTGDGFGGAAFFWNNLNVLIEDCEFLSNAAPNCAAFYIDDRESVTEADNFVIRNCLFEGNTATNGVAGAFYGFDNSMTVEDCDFIANSATSTAGAVYCSGNSGVGGNPGDGGEIILRGNLFELNSGSFGGAVSTFSENGLYTLENNEFVENACVSGGGAVIHGFGSISTHIGGTYSKNTADYGGALMIQNNNTVVDVMSSDFVENSGSGATSPGGAIAMISGATISIDDSNFELNNAMGVGGALSLNSQTDTILGTTSISNSLFTNNFSNVQGGAININDVSVDITNSIFATNSSTGDPDSRAGAISINGGSGNTTVTNIINSTFYQNLSFNGSGITAFAGAEPETSVTVNIGNTIMDDDGDNYLLEDGAPVVNSLGGNLSTDSSTDDILVGTNDISDGLDPEFANPIDLNFYLREDSPARDIGIASIAPATDYLGQDRVGEPDAGAIEFDPDVSIKETIVNAQGNLDIFPNPVNTSLNFDLDNDWSGDIQIEIVDMAGVRHATDKIFKTEQKQNFSIDVNNLNKGAYILIVKTSEEAMYSKMVKM